MHTGYPAHEQAAEDFPGIPNVPDIPEFGSDAASADSFAISPLAPQPITFGELFREIRDGCCTASEWKGSPSLRLFAVFCFAALCSWAGIVLSRQSEGVTTIWLSNGIILGLLITQPPRRWLPYFLAGLTADTLADVVHGDRFLLAFGVSVANSVEVVTSALLLTRLFGVPFDLSRRKGLMGFLGVSVVGATALTSALGASWTLLFQEAGPWWQLFRTWWLGDMLGIAVLTPLTYILSRPHSYAIFRPGELRHTLPVLLVPVLATVLVFTHSGDPLIFFLSPPLLLVAFRLGFPGTVLAIVLVTLIAIGFTVKGHGPLMLIPGEHMVLHRIVVAQILAAVSIFTMFPVAALLEEQNALKNSLASSEVRYKRLAETDALTGLANRRAFNLRLAREWDAAVASHSPLHLLLVDADHFKQYNDVFGHLEGDRCLQVLSGVITEVLGPLPALASRYGGEEFAILWSGPDGGMPARLAERLCAAVVRRRLPHPTGPSGVQTVSVGVASLVPLPGQGSSILIKRADEALYRAKLGGRDRAVSG